MNKKYETGNYVARKYSEIGKIQHYGLHWISIICILIIAIGVYFVYQNIFTKKIIIHETDPLKNVWLSLLPIQCGDNPWEKEWIAENPKKKSKNFPRDKEENIIKSYFMKL